MGTSLTKSLNHVGHLALSGPGGTEAVRRKMLRKDTSITSSIFSSNSSDSCGSQVSVMLPRHRRRPGLGKLNPNLYKTPTYEPPVDIENSLGTFLLSNQ